MGKLTVWIDCLDHCWSSQKWIYWSLTNYMLLPEYSIYTTFTATFVKNLVQTQHSTFTMVYCLPISYKTFKWIQMEF